MEQNDAQWLADLSEREEFAIRELREILARNLRRGLRDRVGVDDAFIEDATQESLLRVLEKLDQFAGRSRFKTWATAIALRIAWGRLRRGSWRDVSLDAMSSNEEGPREFAVDETATPVEQAQRQEILKALRFAMENELTERQRTALTAELKGMPQDEIIRRLGGNRNALYKLTHDARRKLKHSLEAAGFSAEDLAQV